MQTDKQEPPIPCLFFPFDKYNAKLLIYFHGIGVDIGTSFKEVAYFRQILGLNVLAVEYPGFGTNFYKGICTEDQIKHDSYSVLDYILKTT